MMILVEFMLKSGRCFSFTTDETKEKMLDVILEQGKQDFYAGKSNNTQVLIFWREVEMIKITEQNNGNKGVKTR